MDSLEHDYKTVLVARHEPPCISLYQTTYRTYPDKQQNLIRYKNLIREMEIVLKEKYGDRESDAVLQPFHELTRDSWFWNAVYDGLAIFATPKMFNVYRLQRPVRDLVVVADSFHIKPIVRVVQSADRYHILGLSRDEARVYIGNRYVVDEVDLPPGFPALAKDVLGKPDPERKIRVYGVGGGGAGLTNWHGTSVTDRAYDIDTEVFFRAVDRAVWEHYSKPSRLPLYLAALPTHHKLFREISRNQYLQTEAIDVFPGALSKEELRERAWNLVLPQYLARLKDISEHFGAAWANHRGSADISDIARAAAAGQIATLLVEADRQIPGRFDPETGAIEYASTESASSEHSDVDDLLDDLCEHTLRTGGEVVIVPAERMPTDTGIAAIFRYS